MCARHRMFVLLCAHQHNHHKKQLLFRSEQTSALLAVVTCSSIAKASVVSCATACVGLSSERVECLHGGGGAPDVVVVLVHGVQLRVVEPLRVATFLKLLFGRPGAGFGGVTLLVHGPVAEAELGQAHLIPALPQPDGILEVEIDARVSHTTEVLVEPPKLQEHAAVHEEGGSVHLVARHEGHASGLVTKGYRQVARSVFLAPQLPGTLVKALAHVHSPAEPTNKGQARVTLEQSHRTATPLAILRVIVVLHQCDVVGGGEAREAIVPANLMHVVAIRHEGIPLKGVDPRGSFAH
mmetsp:Transcript_13826/g.23365  ORF Transcript_13826/g.23365 Transcript_13826/m.23365 type:complete len:295 (-) Transcript_13826:218-1102(-)